MGEYYYSWSFTPFHRDVQSLEGLLDIQMQFSDDTSLHLAHVSSSDYHLQADTYDKSIVAFAPKIVQHHPRVIAVGKGKGELLLITVELSQACQRPRLPPVARSTAHIEVAFYMQQHQDLQNDGHGIKGSDFVMKSGVFSRNSKIRSSLENGKLEYKLTTDTAFYDPAIQEPENIELKQLGLTPLEIGMYGLLSVFCIAIIMFVISCAVYAVHFSRKQVPTGNKCESVANAHDWVWLGRATVEQNSTSAQIPHLLSYASDLTTNETRTIQSQQVNLASSSEMGCNLSSKSLASVTDCVNDLEVNNIKLIEHNPLYTNAAVDVNISPTFPERQVRILANPVCSLSSAFGLSSINGSATFIIKKPPIPPHASLISKSTEKKHDIPVNTIPNYSSISEILGHICRPDVEWENITMGMNYDQLMDYFDNLKESNA